MKVTLKPVHRQVIVIVGASSGIGLATARLAAKKGAQLVLAARSSGALDRLVHEITSAGGAAIAVRADASMETDVVRIASEAERAFGGFDTWVNNAAVSAYGTCLDVSIDDMRRIMDTNFWGVVYGSRVASARLRKHGGALINMGSVLSEAAVPLQGIYSASKQAIKGWTDALRQELLAEGAPVSVTLIKPSAIGTPYAEHSAKYIEDQPQHVPPVYSPWSVAEAILYAAAHPRREMTVGASGKVLALGHLFAPRITDFAVRRLVTPNMHSGESHRGRPALWTPTEDLRERGGYPGIVRPSISTKLATHPRTSALAALGVALAAALSLRRHRPGPKGGGGRVG